MTVHTLELSGQASPFMVARMLVAEELPDAGYKVFDDVFVTVGGKTYWMSVEDVYPVASRDGRVVVVFKRDICCHAGD